MKQRQFHISDILSIVLDKDVSLYGVVSIYEMLNYMAEELVSTHQVLTAISSCRDYLLQQYPQLKGVNDENINEDNLKDWIDSQVKIFGRSLSVQPLPPNYQVSAGPEMQCIKAVR